MLRNRPCTGPGYAFYLDLAGGASALRLRAEVRESRLPGHCGQDCGRKQGFRGRQGPGGIRGMYLDVVPGGQRSDAYLHCGLSGTSGTAGN